ncbi:hypothetical protein WMY93_007804 [Mugilogobius chulae]|uniref:NADP-dependent oxidoreductase domain-containing protein n=1 Tax=Mugilogobius chulae TaxID=88201 RepID=A0AAW0PKK7_9GOBI
MKGYQWLKERVNSEEGRRQLAKVKELHLLADRLGCTAAQLAIAWCLRSEGVSSVLLGVSNADQLVENLGALRTITEIDALLVNGAFIGLESPPSASCDMMFSSQRRVAVGYV